MSDLLVVVLPTVPGREAKLVHAVRRYMETVPGDVRVHLELMRGYSTCGEAWDRGSERWWEEATWLHYGADDLYPHDGWFEAAVDCCAAGEAPSALVLTPSGAVESGGQWMIDLGHLSETTATMVPFFPAPMWEWVRPIPPIHYHSDNYVSERLRIGGVPLRVRHDYAFTHGRDDGDPGRKSVTAAEGLVASEAAVRPKSTAPFWRPR